MTKQEILDDLKGKNFVFDIESITGGEDIIHKNLNIKVYNVNIFEVVGKVGIGRTIRVYVKDEGTEKEQAFYKDEEPEQKVSKKI